jgi:hypothetical protein
MTCRKRAEKNSERNSDEKCLTAEVDGDGKAVANDSKDGFRRISHRISKITLEELCQVTEVLYWNGAVKAPFMTNDGHHFLGDSLFFLKRVSGDDMHDEEADSDQCKERQSQVS